MHDDKDERSDDERAADRRVAVTAADDTGMIAQQEFLTEAELEDEEPA